MSDDFEDQGEIVPGRGVTKYNLPTGSCCSFVGPYVNSFCNTSFSFDANSADK